MLLRHFWNADLWLIVKNRKCIQVHLINSEIYVELSLKNFLLITLQNVQSSKLLKSQKQQMRRIDAKCIPFDTSTSLIFPILSPEKSQIT